MAFAEARADADGRRRQRQERQHQAQRGQRGQSRRESPDNSGLEGRQPIQRKGGQEPQHGHQPPCSQANRRSGLTARSTRLPIR